MKKTSLLLVIVTISCSTDKTRSNDSVSDSIGTPAAVVDTTHMQADTVNEGEGCIFDDDYKVLTTERLKTLQKDNFIWSDKHEKALFPLDQDTILFSVGGCEVYSTILWTILNNDSHELTDSAYWIQKALALSREFGMSDYEKIISAGKLRIGGREENHVWFEVEDIDEDDNLIYNGIEVTSDGSRKRMEISQYMD